LPVFKEVALRCGSVFIFGVLMVRAADNLNRSLAGSTLRAAMSKRADIILTGVVVTINELQLQAETVFHLCDA